jgi:SpoVK/Ycf46/Vps4 family AAA+-type ATPase
MITDSQQEIPTGDLSPYEDGFAHLHHELHWLNCVLGSYLYRWRQFSTEGESANFRDLLITDEEVDAILTVEINESKGKSVQNDLSERAKRLDAKSRSIRHQIEQRTATSIQKGVFLPLVRIRDVFHLDVFESQVLLICLAPQIDAHFYRLYSYLQNDVNQRNPSVDLVLNLMCSSLQEKGCVLNTFSDQAPLFKFRLLEFTDNTLSKGGSLLSKQLMVNDSVVKYVLGAKRIDTELDPFTELSHSQKDLAATIQPELIKDKLILFIDHYKKQCRSECQGAILSFYGPYGTGKYRAAKALCHEIGLPILVIDMEALSNLELPFSKTLQLAIRDSMLIPASLYIKNVDALFKQHGNSSHNKTFFIELISSGSCLIFLSSEQPLDFRAQLPDQRILSVEFPVPNYSQRKQLWHLSLGDQRSSIDEAELRYLAGKFDLTPGQITDAITAAHNFAFCRSTKNGTITIQDLYEGCRAQLNHNLKSLANKIDPLYTWEDIVLPKDQMLQLREIVNCFIYKHLVYDDWGFNRKFSLGKGLNILFSGPSGTGKTMAAEIIANDLSLELYKIDLSLVVSKYIGETEKNLNKIFNEAKTSNAILFFDEADALFGKRSEVKDAHDRYANIEINYLLQKMEEQEGVVILATNLLKNMDEAFTRRMHFSVGFPFPDEEYRLKIWQNIFPKDTPRNDDIDFEFLAKKLKIPGGSIKNIGLNAAFFAAGNSKIVTMKHIVQATRREYQKMGKLSVPSDFGKYYELIFSEERVNLDINNKSQQVQ